MHLFTGMVAIFNLLDLRSMMGYLGGPRSVFTLYAHFLGKRKLHCIFLEDKGDHHYIQTQHNDFFSHYNLFLGKLKEKLARKVHVNTERVYWIVLTHAPRASHNTP